jgi:uncharacterized protein
VLLVLANVTMENANPVSRWLHLVVLALTLGVAACAKEQPAAPAPMKTVSDFFPIKVGDKTVRMQLAVLPMEQQRGLMQRRDLGPNDGMLFVYERPQAMGFWMRNTPTPLDIGFFDATGTLQEIYPLHPFDEKTVTSNSSQLSYALEMNQGWFKQNGVSPGAKIDLKVLADAMKARGFELRIPEQKK